MLRSIFVLFLVAAWLVPADAAVESVTVFPDRATITRVIETEVRAGRGEVVQSDLPAGLSTDSLRISARGPDGLRLGAFHTRTIRGAERVNPRVRELEARLQDLRDQRDAIDDAIEARDLQLALLRSLASGAGQGDGRLAIEGWEQALGTVGGGAEEVLAARRQLNLDRRDIEREIERLQREIADLGQGQRDTLELTLSYESTASGPAEFTIEYTVGGATWRPIYEWRLDTESGQMAVVQFAEVRQRSGEDWQDAEVMLSLSRPAAGGQLPSPLPWWIDVRQPVEEAALARGARFDQAMSAPVAEADAKWTEAELVGTEYTRAWRVPGRVQVAADNQAHRFQLDTFSIDVALSARAVPSHQPAAWLYAEGTYEGEAALPPGMVTLYQDQTMVGQLRFSGLAPGGELASSFGVDDRIEIERRLIEDQRATEGMIRKSTRLTRVYRINIINGHSRDIDLTILDQMPVSRDERIEVALTSATTAPDERDVNDQPGLLAWNRRLAAGGEDSLTIGYRVTFPESIEGIQGW